MSYSNDIYYSVEPYTGDIICHYATKGMKWGYTKGKKNGNRIAKEERIKYMNKLGARYAPEYNRPDEDYYELGLDPKISKRKLLNGRTSDTAKAASNLTAQNERIKYLTKKYNR